MDVVAIGDSDDEVVAQDINAHECVPCEVCGLSIPFNLYVAHLSSHDQIRSAEHQRVAGHSSEPTCLLDKVDKAGETVVLHNADVPTPQRKRARLDQLHTEDAVQVAVDVDALVDSKNSSAVEIAICKPCGSRAGRVPCEVCGAIVLFQDYEAHASTHSRQSSGTENEKEDRIPCDVCGDMVRVSEFAQHAADHRSSSSSTAEAGNYSKVSCKICSALVDSRELADHMAAHEVHQELVDADLQQSTSEVDITVKIVEMARKGGSGLPGNRRQQADIGDAVLVRWKDGHWYHAHVQSKDVPSQVHVTWDAPFAHWPSENVSEQSIFPRSDQAREVCNFDVALAFVKKLKSMQSKTTQSGQSLELVYHYTREENVNKIVENNLKVPGTTNADGTRIDVKNGSAYGVGIYAATDMRFGQSYGCGLSCAFMCLAIPGRTDIKGKLKKNSDSLQDGALRVYSTSEQLLPLFFTNSQLAPGLETCAREIMDYLVTKLLGGTACCDSGAEVEAFWQGGWWRAKVTKRYKNGKYDLSWSPPYESWPLEKNVSADRVRLLPK